MDVRFVARGDRGKKLEVLAPNPDLSDGGLAAHVVMGSGSVGLSLGLLPAEAREMAAALLALADAAESVPGGSK